MNDFFIQPLQYPFLQQAMSVGLIIAITCALLSCFIVLKGWSLMGDAISHAILPGVVFAAVLGFPLMIGAFFAGLICAIGTGWLEKRSHLKSDTLLGIVFSGMFALGVFLFTRIESDQHLMHVLFGNLLGMTGNQRLQVYIIGGIVTATILIKRRDFILFVFDSAHARVAGLSVNWLYYLLLVLLAMTAIVALQAVGVVLVVSMLITPGISAQLVCQRFNRMMIVAVIMSVFSTLFGILISFHTDSSTSACIVLTQACCFILLLLLRYVRRQYGQLFWY